MQQPFIQQDGSTRDFALIVAEMFFEFVGQRLIDECDDITERTSGDDYYLEDAEFYQREGADLVRNFVISPEWVEIGKRTGLDLEEYMLGFRDTYKALPFDAYDFSAEFATADIKMAIMAPIADVPDFHRQNFLMAGTAKKHAFGNTALPEYKAPARIAAPERPVGLFELAARHNQVNQESYQRALPNIEERKRLASKGGLFGEV